MVTQLQDTECSQYYKTGSTYRIATLSEEDRTTSIGKSNICTKIWLSSAVWFSSYAELETNRHTYTHYNTSHPFRRRSNNTVQQSKQVAITRPPFSPPRTLYTLTYKTKADSIAWLVRHMHYSQSRRVTSEIGCQSGSTTNYRGPAWPDVINESGLRAERSERKDRVSGSRIGCRIGLNGERIFRSSPYPLTCSEDNTQRYGTQGCTAACVSFGLTYWISLRTIRKTC